MEARQAVAQAFRRRLTRSATLTGMVASSHITITARQAVATFPAIRFRVSAAEGQNLRTFLDGDVYLNIYLDSKSPASQLASIYNVVASLIVNKQSALTTTNIGFGRIWEATCDYPLMDEEVNIAYLAARFRFIGQIR